MQLPGSPGYASEKIRRRPGSLGWIHVCVYIYMHIHNAPGAFKDCSSVGAVPKGWNASGLGQI